MRDELLAGEIFYSLKEAQVLIELWRKHYNTIRPHSALGYRPVLTGHVRKADGQPGIFHTLGVLQYGDQFTIEAWGQTYIYMVYGAHLVSPRNLGVLEHSAYDTVAQITCESFDEASGDYRHRRVVTAVLVHVR